MLEAKPSAGIIGHVLKANEPSDHVPALVRFSPGARAHATMPSWVTSHPEFPILIDEAIGQIDLSPDPLSALAEIKEVMMRACDELKSRIYRYGAQTDTHRLT
eukprot:3869415-Pyramimonas_sp.AAC.1